MYTPEQEEEYVANEGQFCPNCHSDNIRRDNWTWAGEDTHVTDKVRCLKCGGQWYEVYELVGIQQIGKGGADAI